MKDKSSLKLNKIITYFLILIMAFSFTPIVSNAENVKVATVSSVEKYTAANTSKIKLNYKDLRICKGKTKKLILKNATGKVKWKSSQASVVKVNAKGKITAKKKGKATVTATYKGKKYKCKVTVFEKKNKSGSGTVYWTPSGEVYHKTPNCPTLSRSKTIYSGSISKSGKSRGCKVCY